MAACCGRRRLSASISLQVMIGRSVLAAKCALQAAARAVGAVGGGWAVLAALRAATNVSRLSPAKCQDADESSTAVELHGPIPKHLAVIMDGNRRFGRERYGESLSGHRAGGQKLHDFIVWCIELGIPVLTVYAFSTENWKRDAHEVEAMMGLFIAEVPRLRDHAMRHDVRVRFLVSDASPLPADVKAATDELEELSASCTGMQLNVCLSYGGRGDIALACRHLATEAARGDLDPSTIDESIVKQALLTGELPDPDVLIRTSGERRLSNFLMFQLAYAEMFFLEQHWPAVSREDLHDVIAQYQKRQRRYGK